MRRPAPADRNASPANAQDATEHLGLRDPQEPTQGPLRLDDVNYSQDRMTPPEGSYNTYADDEESYLDKEDLRPGVPNPQFPEDSQRELLDTLPEDMDRDSQPRVGEHEARGDLAILDDIHDVIADLDDADTESIEVSVQRGTVNLDGDVKQGATRSRIEQALETIPGVTAVCNRLTVRGKSEYARWSDT
ncbi:BON domain-containing protein [Dyella acidiphila]|uniref:BON domain-containing protein n=1 Tax=Dyella acidiphila TaxID=2775866 RepID=A0ABR9GCR5_9GAMM|nr:BON domain-containing protein [Dyella acidiphila]MBE1161827.1 BON domain-containing protein [Dyella acidiphila]